MRRMLCWLIILAGLLAAGPTFAQQPAAPSPEQLRTLAQLLRDPGVQAWLQAQAERTPSAATDAPAAAGEPASAQAMMVSQLDAMRAFLRELVAAVWTLPDELGRAWSTFTAERAAWGGQRPIVLVAMFAALGFGLEGLLWWATTGFRERMIASPSADGAGSPARGRAPDDLRAPGPARLRDRQHRRVPAVRLAAAAQARRARLSGRVPDRPAGARARARSCWRPAPSASGWCRWRPRPPASGSSGRRFWSAGSSS